MSRRLTLQEVLSRFRKAYGDTYDYSKVVFKGNKSKVIVICKKKNHGEFETYPDNHYRRVGGCPKCNRERLKIAKNKLSTKEFINKAIAIHGNFYDYSKVIYSGMNKPIIVICKEHGEFTQSKAQNHLINEYNCPECLDLRLHKKASERLPTLEEAKKKVFAIHRDFIEISDFSMYAGTDTKIKFVCKRKKKHGEWEASLHQVTSSSHITRASGCPVCKMSKGERDILFWLRDNNIKHKWQFRIKKPNQSKKSFFIYDFFLPNHNTLIEFDGRQHFIAIEHWGGEKALQRNKINDKIKSDFAESKGYKLIRIPYTKTLKIDSILANVLFDRN
jgi:very-short-patch-repair endonuclease